MHQQKFHFKLNDFFKVISTLYAIITAFLLWKGLTDHDLLKQSLNDEATKIRSIVAYTFYFDQHGNENKNNVRNLKINFRNHIRNIIDGETIKKRRENDVVMRNNIELISELIVEDKNDEIALQEIMKQFTDSFEIRSRRQSFIERGMSPYLLFSLFIMSVSIIYPFFTKTPEEGGPVVFTMIFIMATLMSFIFITMVDISTPFAGFWKIKTETFSEIAGELESEIGRDEVSVRKPIALELPADAEN